MTFKVETLPRQPKQKYYDVTCDGCNVEVKKVFSDEYLQPDDCLILRLEGGYGMAIDPDGDGSSDPLYTKIFCKDCLMRLCEQWPTFQKTIENGCSSSIGHHCSKERKFVWKPSCCHMYCKGCGRDGSYMVGLENPDDIYSRRIVNCLTGCGDVAVGVWNWEIDNYFWVVQKWEPEIKRNVTLGKFSSEEAAELALKRLVNNLEQDEFSLERIAIINRVQKD